MAGMISQAQGRQPSAQSVQEPSPQQQKVANNPQEQAPKGQIDSKEAYNIAAGQMLKFVYDQAGEKALMSMAKASGDPEKAMSRLIARLLVTTEQSARMSGQKLPPDALFAAGMEAAAAMSEVAQKNGLLDKTNEAEITEAAFFDGLALFGQESAEEALTDNDREAYIAMIDQLESMAGQARQQPPQQQPQPQQTNPQAQQPAPGGMA